MPSDYLTTQSTIQCPHGGQAVLSTANSKTQAGSASVLLAGDTHTVTGCSYMQGNVPSPCLTIEWQAGAGSVQINGQAPLLKSSTGTCKSAQGASQGTALVVNTQMKANGQ